MTVESQLEEYKTLAQIRIKLSHIISSIDDECSLDYVETKLKELSIP